MTAKNDYTKWYLFSLIPMVGIMISWFALTYKFYKLTKNWFQVLKLELFLMIPLLVVGIIWAVFVKLLFPGYILLLIIIGCICLILAGICGVWISKLVIEKYKTNSIV